MGGERDPATHPCQWWASGRSDLPHALGRQLGSAVGGWMQAVGAQWMLVHRPGAATWVSLVQAASLLPVMFWSLPAGVLADVLDRRRLLIGVQSAMTVLAALLTLLTATGRTTPSVLIAFTFLLGCGQAVGNPAWQAIQPELVPREQIPAAAALGSLSVNVARAVGPPSRACCSRSPPPGCCSASTRCRSPP